MRARFRRCAFARICPPQRQPSAPDPIPERRTGVGVDAPAQMPSVWSHTFSVPVQHAHSSAPATAAASSTDASPTSPQPGEPVPQVSVSYAHLTLPTICSV